MCVATLHGLLWITSSGQAVTKSDLVFTTSTLKMTTVHVHEKNLRNSTATSLKTTDFRRLQSQAFRWWYLYYQSVWEFVTDIISATECTYSESSHKNNMQWMRTSSHFSKNIYAVLCENPLTNLGFWLMFHILSRCLLKPYWLLPANSGLDIVM